MKRILLAILAISVALGMAVFAGLSPSLAQFDDGSGSSGSGVTGSGGGGDGCSPPAPYLSVADRLYSVAGTSAHDVWAVGLMPTSSLIMHWNGCSWSESYTEPVGFFNGVSAVSPSNAWAVGGTSWWDPSHTLAVHWNGASWTEVSTLTPTGSGVLTAVDAITASDIWAAGYTGPGPGVITYDFQPLIEHWNGSTWTRVTSPNPGVEDSDLKGVTAISPGNAWAVGTTVDGSGEWEPTTGWCMHLRPVRWKRTL